MPDVSSTTRSSTSFVEVDNEHLEEARGFNEMLEKLLESAPALHTMPPEATRATRAEGRGTFGAVVVVEQGQDRTIPGPAGDIPLRVFVPPTVEGVYLHIHGGGWVLGSAWQQDPALWALAQAANVAVVSVEYRLAPEHPFPAGPDDCEAAALWLIANAADEFGTTRLVIGGESAGGHLAALTLLRLRDRHGNANAFSAANLVFGVYDLGMTPSQQNWGERNLVLSTPIMAWFYDHFLPGLTPEQRRAPQYSPLWAKLEDLPPALFSVGALDPLLDDTLFMAARWQAAGNDAELAVYPEAVHGFVAFPNAIGRMATERSTEFIRRAVTSAG